MSSEQLQTTFENYLRSNAFLQQPSELYNAINYILQLGGKRIRPLLALLSAELFHCSYSNALPVAMAVEIFHNFSLVHDDIMDQAPTRRMKPTVHKLFGTNTAILTGDVMLVYAYNYLIKVANKNNYHKIIDTFNKVAIGVCEGQQMDINFEKSTDVSIDDYITMIRLKTAVLLEGALQLGAIVAEADEQAIQAIGAFGCNIGIAFQLQDDLLDAYTTSATFGKKIGGDIAQNKKTFLYLKALELANTQEKRMLIGLYNDKLIAEDKKIEQVKSLFTKLNIPALTEKLVQEYTQKAFNYLHSLANVNLEAKNELIKISNMLMFRNQ